MSNAYNDVPAKLGPIRAAASAFIRNPDWRDKLIRPGQDPDKPPHKILANALIALRNAYEWDGVLGFNEFAVRVEVLKRTPWGKLPGEQWTDDDDRRTTDWLQSVGILVPTSIAGEAVQTVATERKFNRIYDYLSGLVWDGEKRLGSWATTYLGSDPGKEIARIFGRLWLISAVARALNPGCKADHCLILEGRQGIGKSSALRALAGDWFTDQLPDLGSKDSFIQIHGVWIVEVAELDGFSRSEASRIKQFLTATFDRFRLPYGKQASEWPRSNVFAATTNESSYLKDATGGRRFWPIQCGAIDVEGLIRDRDQLWAEAVAEYRDGARWWLTDERSVQVAEAEQAERYESDPWQGKLVAYVEGRDEVAVSDFLSHLGKPEGQWTRADQMRVASCFRSIGWNRFNARVGTGRVWRYRKCSDSY